MLVFFKISQKCLAVWNVQEILRHLSKIYFVRQVSGMYLSILLCGRPPGTPRTLGTTSRTRTLRISRPSMPRPNLASSSFRLLNSVSATKRCMTLLQLFRREFPDNTRESLESGRSSRRKLRQSRHPRRCGGAARSASRFVTSSAHMKLD